MSNEDTTAEPVVAIDVAAPNAESTVVAAVPAEPKKLFDIESDDMSDIGSHVSPAEDGEVIIFRNTAAARRAKAFKELRCYVYDYVNHNWWNPLTSKWDRDRLAIRPQTIEQALSWTSVWGTLLFYVRVMPEDPNKPKRKCRITDYMEQSEVDMLKLSPNNATFRARVMAAMEEMPPTEADTYEKIKDWIEFNFPKEKPAVPEKPKAERTLSIAIEGSIEDSGTCCYRSNETFRGNPIITEQWIRQQIQQHGTEEDVMTAIHDELVDMACNHVVDTEESTDDHESSGNRNTDINYSMTPIREFVRSVAREVLSRDEYVEFLPEE